MVAWRALVLLCVLGTALASQDVVVDGVWDAENQFFTATGRLFVTGGDNVFEVTRASPTAPFAKAPLFPKGTGYFLGLTEWRDHLVVAYQASGADATPMVAAAPLVAGQPPHFTDVWTLENFSLPNGVETVGGYVLVADSAMGSGVHSQGRIVALTMSLDPHTHAVAVTAQRDVITHAHGAVHPNGLLFDAASGTLFFTDLDGVHAHVRRIPLDAATATPARPSESLYSRLTVFDDLAFVALSASTRALAVCDFVRGQVVLLDAASGAELSSSSLLAFRGPSSVQQGAPPMFAADELVVTNKGVVRSHLPVGNFVGAWRFK